MAKLILILLVAVIAVHLCVGYRIARDAPAKQINLPSPEEFTKYMQDIFQNVSSSIKKEDLDNAGKQLLLIFGQLGEAMGKSLESIKTNLETNKV